MPEEPGTSATPPVSDHRPVPRGVLPRRFQTWLMAGLAFGILLIILVTGQSTPPANPGPTQAAPLAPNPDRLRDYQERLRAMESRQAQEAQAPAPTAPDTSRFEEPAGPAPEPRWTAENRPLIDTSKPATTGVATETASC